MAKVIRVSSISKKFVTYQSRAGENIFLASMRRKKVIKQALDGISFDVEEGEALAILGRNGSGKTTLIKTLTGILHPDSGTARVLGLVPWKEREKLAWKIGMVSGAASGSVMFENLPAIDTFEYLRAIYNVPKRDFEYRLEYLTELLNMEDVLKRQVIYMSLGEKMKCNFIAAVLHMPKILFLDEPTVGIDVTSNISLRNAVIEMQKEYKTTVVLTTHIIDDIKAMANRVVLINNGKKVFDGDKYKLRKIFGDKKELEIRFYGKPHEDLSRFGKILELEDDYVKLEIESTMLRSTRLVKLLNSKYVADYNASDLDLNSVLPAYYSKLKSGEI